MKSKRQLSPNQNALNIINELIVKCNGLGLFKELEQLDLVRNSFGHLKSEIIRLEAIDRDQKTGKNGSANKSKQ